MINPYVRQPTGSMYGISPISSALAQVMALGMGAYQTSKEAKAKQLAEILAMRREREKEERVFGRQKELLKIGQEYKKELVKPITPKPEVKEYEVGGKRIRQIIDPTTGRVIDEQVLGPVEAPGKQKRAERTDLWNEYTFSLKAITKFMEKGEDVTEGEILLYNRLKDRIRDLEKELSISMKIPLPAAYAPRKLTPTETAEVTKQAREISGERLPLWKQAMNMFIPAEEEFGAETRPAIVDSLAQTLAGSRLVSDEEGLRQPQTEPVSIEDLKSRYPDFINFIDKATHKGHTFQEIFDYILSKQK